MTGHEGGRFHRHLDAVVYPEGLPEGEAAVYPPVTAAPRAQRLALNTQEGCMLQG